MQNTFEYEISKRFSFSASHTLKRLIGASLADGSPHPCSRLHGHNYVVDVLVRGDNIDANGFLLDYHELVALKTYLDERFDHRDLNDVMQVDNPTAEVVARRLLRFCQTQWPRLDIEVSVEETPATRATCRYSHALPDDERIAKAIARSFSSFLHMDESHVAQVVHSAL